MPDGLPLRANLQFQHNKKMRYKASQFIAAIDGSGGFITTIAKRVGCDRGTVYNAMSNYPTVKQAILDEKDGLKDMAENELLRQIKDGNTTATIFFLKTQAKDRGYIERQEITGKDGDALRVKFIDYGIDDNPD